MNHPADMKPRTLGRSTAADGPGPGGRGTRPAGTPTRAFHACLAIEPDFPQALRKLGAAREQPRGNLEFHVPRTEEELRDFLKAQARRDRHRRTLSWWWRSTPWYTKVLQLLVSGFVALAAGS